MSKRKKKNTPKARNAQAYAASVICKGGAHQDGRRRRRRTRSAERRAALREQGY